MPHFSKGTKYVAANITLVVLAFVVFQYYTHANGSGPQSDRTGMIVGGIALYLLLGGVIVFRAYYRKHRFEFLDRTPMHTAVAAEGLLGAERLKNITLQLHVSEDDFHTLTSTGHLILKPEAFEVPIRAGDAVQVHTGDAGRSGFAPARIADIDGYNQKVTVELNHTPRAS